MKSCVTETFQVLGETEPHAGKQQGEIERTADENSRYKSFSTLTNVPTLKKNKSKRIPCELLRSTTCKPKHGMFAIKLTVALLQN